MPVSVPEPSDGVVLFTWRVAVPVLPAASVCDAVTVTDPAGSPPTLTPETVQAPLVQGAEAVTLPMLTVTAPSSVVQVPETL
ncbi:hypothetical protein D3C72_1593590 [compost metagenome]